MWRSLGTVLALLAVACAYETEKWKNALTKRLSEESVYKQHDCYTLHVFGTYMDHEAIDMHAKLNISAFKWQAKMFSCQHELEAINKQNALDVDFLNNYPKETWDPDDTREYFVDKDKVAAVFSTIVQKCTETCNKPQLPWPYAFDSNEGKFLQSLWCTPYANRAYTDMQLSVSTFVTKTPLAIDVNKPQGCQGDGCDQHKFDVPELSVMQMAEIGVIINAGYKLKAPLENEIPQLKHFSKFDLLLEECEPEHCKERFTLMLRDYIFFETILYSMTSQCWPSAQLEPNTGVGAELDLEVALDLQNEQDRIFVQNLQQLSGQEGRGGTPPWAYKEIKNILLDASKNNLSVGSYGAPAKAFTMFSFLEIDRKDIKFCVDTTPTKIDKFFPNFGIPVISEESLKKEIYDILIINAWNYKDEIKAKSKTIFKKGTKLVFPIPYLEVFEV